MSKSDFFEKAMNDLDEKYINEAAEELYKRQGSGIIVTDNRVAKPQKNSGIKMFLGVAAAVALVIGGFAVLNYIDGNKPVIDDNPSGNEITDKVTKYDSMLINSESGEHIKIYRDINDENSRLMVELIEELEKLTLEETSYTPAGNGDTDSIFIELSYGYNFDTYILTHCYAGATLEKTIVEKNGVTYEASGDELIRAMEIITELMKSSVPTLRTGEYYLNGDPESGVSIFVLNGKIGLWGDKALDFVKENYNGEDTSYTAPYDLYNNLGEKEFVVSSLAENPLKMPILTEWDKTVKVNANQYEGESYYYFAGYGENGQIIELLDNYFYFNPLDNIEYESEFAKGTIEFTKLQAVDVISTYEAKAKVNELDGKKSFDSLTGEKTGINRFGETVIPDYKFSYDLSWEDSMGDSVIPSDCVYLTYNNMEAYSYITIFAGQPGSAPPTLMMGNGMGLEFPLFNNENERISEFRLDDGTVLRLKIGGVEYEGGGGYQNEYYVADWTDEEREINYRVTGRGCTRDEFINAVISLIYDVDGIGNLNTGSDSGLPTNFADYTMDFQIFYDYFRGIWQNNEAVYDVELGWNDDFFDYDNPLIGFYKDGKGAYMARQSGKEYVVYFISEEDRNSMPQYVVTLKDDGTYTVPEIPGTIYTKKGAGKFVSYAGVYGYLGIWELCTFEGIDFEALHNLSFDDKDGEHWSRHNDTVFNDWGDMGVLQRNYKESSDELVLALKFLNGDGVTEQYFLCNLKKNDDGTLTLTETPYKFDISELDIEASQTENAKKVKNEVDITTTMGIDGYYEVADFNVYRVSEDSYYLFRSMGVNQGQWHSCIDIFYYSGEILDYYDYKPVMYSQVEGDFQLDKGNYWLAVDDGYLYYLSGDIGENEFYISCIYEGKEISRYDIGYLDCPGFRSVVNDTNGYVNVVFKPLGSDDEWKYTVDFSNPYAPKFVGITNLTDPENTSGLYGEYRFVHDVGEKLDKSDYTVTGESDTGSKQLMDEMYLITAKDAENLLLKPYQTLVFTINDNKGYRHTENDEAWFSFTSNKDIIHVEVGYIADGVAHRLYYGQTDKNSIDIALSDLPTGEYQMYITNYSGYLQYYDFIGIAVT